MEARVRSAHSSTNRDHEVDVLVIGSGAAGMTAALVSALEGARTCFAKKRRCRRGGRSVRWHGVDPRFDADEPSGTARHQR